MYSTLMAGFETGVLVVQAMGQTAEFVACIGDQMELIKEMGSLKNERKGLVAEVSLMDSGEVEQMRREECCKRIAEIEETQKDVGSKIAAGVPPIIQKMKELTIGVLDDSPRRRSWQI